MRTIISMMLPSSIKFKGNAVQFGNTTLEAQDVADICFATKGVVRSNGLLNTVAYCLAYCNVVSKDKPYYSLILEIVKHSSSNMTACDLLKGDMTSRELMTFTATTLKALDFAQKRTGCEPNVSRFYKR